MRIIPKELILLGYSGHSLTVIDIIISLNISIYGYLLNKESFNNPFNLKYIGDDHILDSISNEDFNLFVSIGDNFIRNKLMNKYNRFHFELLIHKSAIVASSVEIGEGSLVAGGAILNPFSTIGIGAIINTAAIIEHECIIGDFAHIAPGVVLAGNVKVGNRSFVGANATVKQGVIIGDDVTIGAGSVVLNDVPDGATVVGNPGRIIK